jgi:exodeoxyribonuclease VII large subunit
VTGLFDDPFEDEPRVEPPAPRAARARRVYTVTELTCEIRQQLEDRFTEIWVEGEISNCRRWNTGHYYFTLKDRGAQLRSVLFRTAASRLRFTPEDGQLVIVRGQVSVYEPKGDYQLICQHLEPKGAGALQVAFEQLKRRLQAEGLFDQARKRPLPVLPRKIGVVTSLDGAAVRDIVSVITRRHRGAHLVIRPARVQGPTAAGELTRALRQIARVDGLDVVILARGGGALEDLAAFNDESLARAIAACPVPVICGVGHEVDFTIADFVADVRAATPSNAAELVVASTEELLGRVRHADRRLRDLWRAALQARRQRLTALAGRTALAGVPHRVALRGRDLDDLVVRLGRATDAGLARLAGRLGALRARLDAADQRRRLAGLRHRLLACDAAIGRAMTDRRHRADRALRVLAGRLDTLSPLGVLARGYAVCWTGTGETVVRDAAAVAVGDRVRVTLARGGLDCTVTDRSLSPAPSTPGDMREAR